MFSKYWSCKLFELNSIDAKLLHGKTSTSKKGRIASHLQILHALDDTSSRGIYMWLPYTSMIGQRGDIVQSCVTTLECFEIVMAVIACSV
jgi:predicted transcriptional regulator